LSDPKKPPEDFDPDKTVVDVRRPGAEKPSEKPKEASSDDAERTVVMSRKPAASAPADPDRTVMTPQGGGGARPADGDATMVSRPTSGAEPSLAGAGFLLACLSGPDRGRRYPVSGSEVIVGSNPSCQIILKGASPIHAKLSRSGDSYSIQNLGAPGSVVARGRASQTMDLKSGDLLKINDAILRFVKSGEVFSSDFSEDELKVSGLSLETLKQRPMIVVAAVLAIVLLAGALYTMRSPRQVQTVAAPEAPADEATGKEVEALISAGTLLYNEGRYVAPPDRPDLDNAYQKFNQALSLDPGNEEASGWLRKIDARLEELRNEREEQEKRRREAERARLAAERAALQERVREILAKGDALFEEGKVVEPVGQNALVYYQQALEVDKESPEARERVQRAIYHHVQQGDALRDRNDRWRALEQYRKAARAAANAGLQADDILARVQDTESSLRAGMTSTGGYMVIYRDDRGQLFMLDELEKVPARYRDRAVEVKPEPAPR
jgi:hypothetical protein